MNLKYIQLDEMQEPKIGDIVATQLDQIYNVVIHESGEYFDFPYSHYNKTAFDDDITLLRYMGNGIFKELYTEELVQYSPILNFNIANLSEFVQKNEFLRKYGCSAYLNGLDFTNRYQSLCETVLLVNNISFVNNTVLKKIGSNYGGRNSAIFDYLMKLKETALLELEKSKKNITIPREVINFAYGENILYDFKNDLGLRRTFVKDNDNSIK